MEFERRKFDEVSPISKLELMEDTGLEVVKGNYSTMPYSFGDVVKKGCCQDTKEFERTKG